jgi:hypothetical protein
MTYYSRPLEMPKTRKEGLLNFVQMIINAAERGECREAMLIAVDLHDTLSGNANPWKDLTDGFTKEAVGKEIAEARLAFKREKQEAVAKAYEKGMREQRRLILKQLEA